MSESNTPEPAKSAADLEAAAAYAKLEWLASEMNASAAGWDFGFGAEFFSHLAAMTPEARKLYFEKAREHAKAFQSVIDASETLAAVMKRVLPAFQPINGE
ncbi:MAG: hypothetical protein ACTHLN_13010 [Tepidisphaeraceae bacterium]